MQFLSETLEAVYVRFKLSHLVNNEYKRRAFCKCAKVEVFRSHSYVSVCVKEIEGRSSTIEIGKLDEVSKKTEKVGETPVVYRTRFGVVFHKNKIFVLGGYDEENCYEPMKSVNICIMVK